jgi:hypothetical protein
LNTAAVPRDRNGAAVERRIAEARAALPRQDFARLRRDVDGVPVRVIAHRQAERTIDAILERLQPHRHHVERLFVRGSEVCALIAEGRRLRHRRIAHNRQDVRARERRRQRQRARRIALAGTGIPDPVRERRLAAVRVAHNHGEIVKREELERN